jgi:hypothetical protein
MALQMGYRTVRGRLDSTYEACYPSPSPNPTPTPNPNPNPKPKPNPNPTL